MLPFSVARSRSRGTTPPTAIPQKKTATETASRRLTRIEVRGKFLWDGDRKFYVRGVTYGTFRPDDQGEEFHDPSRVEADFAEMSRQGINAVRTYTTPPLWVLDLAERHGLRVMVGLAWEQHLDFLSDGKRASDIENRVATAVRDCKSHPAILCFAIGNEIPAAIVRYLGVAEVENFLKRLYNAVKREDPKALVTYVNYPSTEYLRPPSDIVCFNVYLESQKRLEAYLARLQNIADEKPLIMAEIGLDSRRNGERKQAQVLDWQVRTAFGGGCAGAFVFAWTDEWFRGGHDIEDWDFGLTDREREPKAALAAVREAFADVPLPRSIDWPTFSVVICSYNGARTIGETLEAAKKIDYPSYEIVVVNDGSKDNTREIAESAGVRVITTLNKGLSNARNTGMAAANGELIAYLDDDAFPDPHWLTYLASMFLQTDYAAIGGPNLPPDSDGLVANCVSAAPGGPVHVLITDTEAEHIPGCNFAVRKSALQAIGGFDPRFRVAGDDVDACWRLHEHGYKIGFSHAAMVWHHRRNSVGAYWRQQRGYGRAEAMLEQKWPSKYNSAGHIRWHGQLYGPSAASRVGVGRGHIRFGQWGTGLFQSLYTASPGKLRSLPLMPEWYLVISWLAMLTLLGLVWKPLLWSGLALIAATGLLIADAVLASTEATFPPGLSRRELRRHRILTVWLHLLQPFARLRGRITEGLTPWTGRAPGGIRSPRSTIVTWWSEKWESPEDRLQRIEEVLQNSKLLVYRGGDFDRWDLEVRGGTLGAVKLLMGIEEHGAGRQMVRIKVWPKISFALYPVVFLFTVTGMLAANDGASTVGMILLGIAGLLVAQGLAECGVAKAAACRGIDAGLSGSGTIIDPV
jgi:GT2 family glycosyltransferase